MATRTVAAVVDTVKLLEGGGFEVRRPFPTRRLDHFDPFLLIDHLGPVELGPREAKGAPDHPHRGFETVTYILDGRLEHRDSHGNSGSLGPGDVQWMTAGAGVVHSEMPARDFYEKGGRLHGFQVWVNLPAKDKLMQPRYQDLTAARIPVAKSPDGKVEVRVIAGESLGVQAVTETRTPMHYLHFKLAAGARHRQALPPDFNAFAYVFSGEATVAGGAAHEGQAVFLEADGDEVELSSERGGELLLLAGRPINEPVARHGPFVMNTRQELLDAVADFQSGRMGEITARRN